MGVDLVTFGCRLNGFESETIRRQAEAAGLSDVTIVNTCAVTAEATRQARQKIRSLKRQHPDMRIVVTGCAAQVEPERFAEMPEVTAVLGNADKVRPASWQALAVSNSFAAGIQTPADKLRVTDIMQVREMAPHLIDGYRDWQRAFVQVQNGCDHRCTFCIIPYGRGPSRSAPMGQVVDQIRALVAAGVAEVVLTGVDTSSYGGDLPGAPRLGDLVQAILRHVPELPRLRLSSIDALDLDPALQDAFANEVRLAPHLHLSLQHGDDLILKRMKRRHSRAEALALITTLRGLRPDMTFGADFIAGFPTEDEAMFARTLSLIEEADLAYVHAFPYSPRPGTPAARMPQLDVGLIKARAATLREAAKAAHRRHLARQIGRTLDVLMEQDTVGRAGNFSLVQFARPQPYGRVLATRIAALDGDRLVAA